MRRHSLLLIALAGAFAVPACGDDGDDTRDTTVQTGDETPTTAGRAPAADLARAVALTAGESRVQVEASGTLETTGSPAVEIVVTSHVDMERRRGVVVGEDDRGRTRMLVDGQQFWVTSDAPSFTNAMPPESTWVVATFDEVSFSVVASQPAAPIFPLYLAGATNVRRDVDRYLFDLDLARAAEQAPDDRRQDLLELMGAEDGTATVSGEATLDSSGRLHRLVLDGLVADSEAAAPTRAHWDVTFNAYGEPVELEVPDPDDVVDLRDVPELNDTFFRGK